MKRKPRIPSLSSALSGFLIARAAAGYSHRTLENYQLYIRQFIAFVGDRPADEVTADDVRSFLAHILATGRSARTAWTAYVALSSMWTWLHEEFRLPHIVRQVESPKYIDPVIEIFSEEDIRKLLKAARYMKEADTHNRRRFRMRRATAKRDEAIILVLLDTGLRASELCALRIGDVDLKTGEIVVRCGKGGKGRVVFLGRSARKALWRYLQERDDPLPDEPLFLTRSGRPFDRQKLGLLIRRLGERAGVKANPHLFRHTFATMYLVNGGSEMMLQRLLGHSSPVMVQKYVHFAEVHMSERHKTASPVDRWRL